MTASRPSPADAKGPGTCARARFLGIPFKILSSICALLRHVRCAPLATAPRRVPTPRRTEAKRAGKPKIPCFCLCPPLTGCDSAVRSSPLSRQAIGVWPSRSCSGSPECPARNAETLPGTALRDLGARSRRQAPRSREFRDPLSRIGVQAAQAVCDAHSAWCHRRATAGAKLFHGGQGRPIVAIPQRGRRTQNCGASRRSGRGEGVCLRSTS